MEFNSQICTTKEQSERLLALGLKKETADMVWSGLSEWPICHPYNRIKHLASDLDDKILPAWSLHRLIEMMPQEIFYEDSILILGVFGDGVYYADNEYGEVFRSFDGNLYECIIKCIDWLIKEGYFNKEYLEVK